MRKHNKSRKRVRYRHTRSHTHSYFLKWIFAAVGLAIFLVVVKVGYVSLQKSHILGTYIAEGGTSGGGDSGSGSGDHGGSSGGGDHSSGGGSSGGGGSSSSGGGSSSGDHGGGGNSNSSSGGGGTSGNVSDNAIVDCVGPDGKHSTATFKSCSDFNNAWHNNNFSFTVLQSAAKPETEKVEIKEPKVTEKPEIKLKNEIGNPNLTPGKFDVKTADNKTKVKLETSGTKLEFEAENDKFVVKAKKADGTEVELEENDALEKINEALKENEVEIGTASAQGFTIKRGEVEAETHFPLSIDLTTKSLTVTTPAGTKTVAILPDQAIQNLLSLHDIDRIESETASAASNIKLVENEKKLVFEINGFTDKKLLGFIPLSFKKKSLVSAENGQLVKTEESIVDRVLELFSL